ncbi:hypothetical protein [Dietzia cercidiphylli]
MPEAGGPSTQAAIRQYRPEARAAGDHHGRLARARAGPDVNG